VVLRVQMPGKPNQVGRTMRGKRSPATAPPAIAGLTQAQVNLVQAAFKAGVKPSAIARQFGISPKLIQ
jgi:hypothetical protein